MRPRPLMLVILDGWGIREERSGNAVAAASLPNYRELLRCYPHTRLDASGEAVGLPAGQQGNSEVGHLNMGAGRIVYQELTRISRAVADGSFFHNLVLKQAMEVGRQPGHALHLLGLVSDGGVHSHLDHLIALLDMAGQYGVEKIFVHAFLDGRDVPPACAATYLEALERKFQETGRGALASIMGRYYAMDRDKRWERTARAYAALVAGKGRPASNSLAGLEAAYAAGETDEFVQPTVIVGPDGEPVGKVRPGDAVIFFNFRADRARQLTLAFVEKDFSQFDRPGGFQDVYFACLTQYDVTIPAPVAFAPQAIKNTLGEVLANYGYQQLRIAETEKYAHVTFFFNGGVEEPYPGEDRVLIPSPKVATYDLQPEMSAFEVTETVVAKIIGDAYDVIILNFANPDMVGHTGNEAATIQALEAVDACLGRISEAVLARGGVLLVTGDHGNAEQMVDLETGEPHTAHTTNPVPFIMVSRDVTNWGLPQAGALRDVAPTMLEILGVAKPEEMTGGSLLQKNLTRRLAYDHHQ